MEKQVRMKLLRYTVDKMSFMMNKNFKATQGEKIEIKPIFTREITKVNDTRFIITLSVSLSNLEREIPFYLDVQISGIFDVENWEDPQTQKFIVANASQILYPYLRSLVTMLTANAHVPPYHLPIANTEAIFH